MGSDADVKRKFPKMLENCSASKSTDLSKIVIKVKGDRARVYGFFGFQNPGLRNSGTRENQNQVVKHRLPENRVWGTRIPKFGYS